MDQPGVDELIVIAHHRELGVAGAEVAQRRDQVFEVERDALRDEIPGESDQVGLLLVDGGNQFAQAVASGDSAVEVEIAELGDAVAVEFRLQPRNEQRDPAQVQP